MVTLPSGKVMIIGGYSKNPNFKSVIVFDPSNNTFNKSLPSYDVHEIYFAGCVVFNSPMHNFRPIVLAVGEYDPTPEKEKPWEGYQAKAKLLDFTQHNSTWIDSKIHSD